MVLRWSIGRSIASPTGLSPSLACHSWTGSTHKRLCNSLGLRQDPDIDSYNPRSETAAAYRAERVWAVPVSLATTQGMISFPPATEMFQFAGLPLPGLFDSAWSDRALPRPGFPIRTPLDQRLQRLPRAFRRLPRPSSAPGAKASTTCPL